jgi:hypothetical protein
MSKSWPPTTEQIQVYANLATKYVSREKTDCVVHVSWSEPENAIFIPKEEYEFEEGLQYFEFVVKHLTTNVTNDDNLVYVAITR